MIMIENGDYSDWQYNRINVIQLSAFLMEAYLMVFSLLEFQIRKSQYNVLSDYQNIILHSILIVSLIKIIVLWLKNKAELDFYKSKLFENWYTPFYKSKFQWLFIKEMIISFLVPTYFFKDNIISHTYK